MCVINPTALLVCVCVCLVSLLGWSFLVMILIDCKLNMLWPSLACSLIFKMQDSEKRLLWHHFMVWSQICKTRRQQPELLKSGEEKLMWLNSYQSDDLHNYFHIETKKLDIARHHSDLVNCVKFWGRLFRLLWWFWDGVICTPLPSALLILHPVISSVILNLKISCTKMCINIFPDVSDYL